MIKVQYWYLFSTYYVFTQFIDLSAGGRGSELQSKYVEHFSDLMFLMLTADLLNSIAFGNSLMARDQWDAISTGCQSILKIWISSGKLHFL